MVDYVDSWGCPRVPDFLLIPGCVMYYQWIGNSTYKFFFFFIRLQFTCWHPQLMTQSGNLSLVRAWNPFMLWCMYDTGRLIGLGGGRTYGRPDLSKYLCCIFYWVVPFTPQILSLFYTIDSLSTNFLTIHSPKPHKSALHPQKHTLSSTLHNFMLNQFSKLR